MVASALIQAVLESKFTIYSNVPASVTGAEAARKMLAENGINDVTVTCIGGHLTDHYNPTNKTINLSESVYNSRSFAIGVVSKSVIPEKSSHSIARALALISTGRVTKEKSVVMANIVMPAHRSPGNASDIMTPRSNTHETAWLQKLTTGTNALRSLTGA